MNNKLLPVAILAGGLATRLRPLTEKIPKALIDINGEPFIAHQLRLLKKQGITRVVICAGFLGEMIQEYLGNGEQFNMDVAYSFDGDILRGTGGAIQQALPLLGGAFFVLYGDSYLPCDYYSIQKSFIQQNQPGLMTVFCNDNRWDQSNVYYENQKIIKYDKQNKIPEMQHIDYGLGLFKSEVFAALPPEKVVDLAVLHQKLIQQKQLAAYEVSDRFYEIGSLNGIKETAHYLSSLGENR